MPFNTQVDSYKYPSTRVPGVIHPTSTCRCKIVAITTPSVPPSYCRFFLAVLKSTLVGASVDIPVTNGKLALGSWQGVYLCEHRDSGGYGGGRARNITVTVQGVTGDG